jgi:pimeloyl-ACP methyl ester carboxylesterase
MRQTVESGMFVRSFGRHGRGVLWVHGLGESGLCFEAIVQHRRLAGLRHLVPDMPVYGRSTWRRRPFTLAAQADHLAAWLRERREGPVVVVGHSMGGVVATLLAEAHPAAVAAVVDVDGNASVGDCTFSGEAAALSLADFASGGMERLANRIYREGVEDPAHRGYYASIRLCDPRAYHRNSEELVELAGTEALAGRLAALEAKTLYVAGSPGGACARSLELLDEADAQTVELAPSGHWPFIDQPDGFAEELASFLDGVTRR